MHRFRLCIDIIFFFQAEDGIRDLVRSRGLGDVYKRQNVVCEVMRADPDPHVLRWMESIAPGGIGITAVTVEEIERGIGRLAPGRRRRDLDRRWRAVINGHGEDGLPHRAPRALQTAEPVSLTQLTPPTDRAR